MTRVKICGVCRVEDARLACELGAAAVGFIFWPASPRFIDPYRARRIVSDLPPFVVPIGVFVDQPVQYVADVAGLVHLGAVQLHGGEDVAGYQARRLRVIKAVAVGDGFDPDGAMGQVPESATVLLDAHDPIRRGGTGQTIDWARAAEAARLRPVILSGGLTPGNVREAVAHVRPYALDVSSGVEASPGIKDPAKLEAFFAAVNDQI